MSGDIDKFQRRAVTIAAARQAILDRTARLDPVELELSAAYGHRLAEDIRTIAPIPHFRRSGMDGYALRASDQVSSLPAELEVVEWIPCGNVPERVIKAGQAARIMTGAMVPEGADTVIMQEMTDTVVKDGRQFVSIRKPAPCGANITPIGEEAAAGTLAISAGSILGAGQTAVMASLGYSAARVYRKPKAAILSTGTELLRVSEPLRMGQIRNSNTAMLAAQVRSAGGEPLVYEHIPDDRKQMEQTIDELFSSEADLVITTGGVSVGDYDLIADLLANWEGTTLFNKVAMRPGSVTSAGVWKSKLLIGLSGNPSACFVGFELFVRPALLRMQGAQADAKEGPCAYLAEDYSKVNAYARLLRGVRVVKDGKLLVKPIGLDKSSELLTLCDADCLIVIPPTKTGVRAGEFVQFIPVAMPREG